ncbi:MAG: AraC family transcriptional regulator [Halopseudomonas sp.]|uniref:AraC family transcriptional regulator n=1 Tax=Halopseudomonas sp. TaxID=2901191 RepID=UPI0030035A14
MNWRERRDNTNVHYLLTTAHHLGVASEICLQTSGLSERGLQAGEGIELWQELAVIRNLVTACPQPGLGLLLGEHYHLTSLGLLGYTMLASNSLADALQVSSRFRALSLSICPVSLVPDTLGLYLSLDERVLPADARATVIERGLAAWLRVFSELLQRPFVPLRIELNLLQPAPEQRYAEYFGCRIDLQAGRNAMLIAEADLHAPLPLANAMTQAACASLCQQLCASVADVHTPLARQVMQLLMSRTGGSMGAAQAARLLGTSERSLHRRLAAEGHAFRLLDARVRCSLAERLLRDTDLQLEAIAQQLGYTEAASFSRAFKRWRGCSPAHWRQRQTTGVLAQVSGATLQI